MIADTVEQLNRSIDVRPRFHSRSVCKPAAARRPIRYWWQLATYRDER